MVEKLVPKLRFNEFHDGWNTIFLNNILSFKNGFNASKDQYGFGTKFINVTDILENNYLTYDNIQDYVNVDENELSNYIIEYGDIVFQRSSENREEVGTANVYLGSQPCVYGGFVIRGKKEGNYNPFFLKELLQSTRVRKEITSWSGGSTRYNIGQDSLNKISVSLPSIEEQNKIADLLLKVYEKIDLLNYKFQCYNNFKKYLMQQIFTQKLRFDFDDEWKNIPFKKILKEINEKTTVNNQHEILSSTKEGIFTQKEYFADRNVASKDNTGYKILRKNQIVLSPQNLWMGNINVNTEFDIGIVSPSYKIYETTDLVDINYFKHVIKLPRLIYEYTCTSEQGASIVRRNLNKQLFNEITIKVPSHDEQKKIGNLLDVCDEKIKNIDKNIKDMKEFKKGLLQQMFI